VLGLSLTKILFTILVIVVVWRAFALLNRLQERQRQQAVEASRRTREPSRGGRTSSSPSGVVDMVQCPDCGAYVPRGQPCRCGRRT
jgi:hypothetical protein